MKSEVFSVGLLNKYKISIPENVFKPFHDNKISRVKVTATFKGNKIEFYAAVKKDKNTGDYEMMFGKRLQKELGVFLNDYFSMQFFEDTSKYGVDMPEELDAVFKTDFEAFDIFESLTPGKQRSIIYTIIRIKTSQTRIDKALIMCDNLKRGERNPMKLFKN